MNIPREAAVTTGIDQARDAANSWPLLSERELNRLRFLAYCRTGGRIRLPAPVRADVDTICDEIVATLVAERAAGQVPLVPEPLSYPRDGSTASGTGTPAWRAKLASVPATFAARRDCTPGE